MHMLLSVLLIGILGNLVNAQSRRGTIDSPANGTRVSPDEWVDFRYYSMAEYSYTSYNFSVWLFTSDPREGLFTGQATGVSLGKYSYSSSTNTNPSNPSPPAQVWIPDFSIGSGFGGGMNKSDAPLWISVFEEYGHSYSFGALVAYTSNQLVYNATTIADTEDGSGSR